MNKLGAPKYTVNTVGANKIWGKRKNQGGCIYDPEDLLRSYG
jgi:hypothetical protein